MRFVRADGSPFVPRGADYIRLNGSDAVAPVYHATFSPLFYNATAVQLAMGDLAAHGYNVVRVFIDSGDWTRTDGVNGAGPAPLSLAYILNVASFIRIASASGAGVYTMLTLNGLPANAYFANATGAPPAWCEYPHCDVMAPGFVSAWSQYANAFASMLVSALKGDTSGVIAYSLVNEGFFLDTTLPFAPAGAGLEITTADGGVYNMSSNASRQQCADANAVHWATATAAAARRADPLTMVTVGMFTFEAVGKLGPNGINPEGPDPRHPFRASVITRFAGVNYTDVHVYPDASDWTLAEDLASDEWSLVDPSRMPLAMFEFGAFKHFFATAPAAATAMAALQAASCAYNFSAWALWTYDTYEQQDILWNMMDDGGAIRDALAPSVRPDPCVAVARTT